MKDMIYREDAIKAIHTYWKGELSKMPTTDSEYGEVIDGDCDTILKHNKELSTRIKGIPSADRLQGKWMWDDDYHRCSNCHCVAPLDGEEYWMRDKIREDLTEICPNCGARMK